MIISSMTEVLLDVVAYISIKSVFNIVNGG